MPTRTAMTVPNLITSLRIILAPVFTIYLLSDQLTEALVVFVIAGLSDGADGFIARVFNQKSKLGSYLDPLADKMLLVTAFVVLAVRGYLPPWLTVMAISRDVLIMLGVLILSLNKGFFMTIQPSIVSKLTTCFQLATIFLVLAREAYPDLGAVLKPVFWITGALTVASGLHYMAYWFRLMGDRGGNSVGNGLDKTGLS